MRLFPLSLVGALALAAVAGCGVDDEEAGGGSGVATDPNVAARAQTALVSGARRLSRTEYDDTVHDLLGDDSHSGFANLPEDVNDPFDNNYTTQLVSPSLIEAAESLATAAAKRALADPAHRDAIIGCKPRSATDGDCLRKFIKTFGRRALRRPLGDDEIAEYAALGSFSQEANDFYVGVELVLRAVLQDPEFLYRVEAGTEVPGVPGVFKLGDFEVATRLSYFLWGTTPNDALLDLAEQHKLSSPADVRSAAATMLADARARGRVNRFHALWLSYHQLPHPAELTAALRGESEALVNRVVFDDKRPYTDVFTSTETFLTPTLATHYGLPAPASPTGSWVSYGSSGRVGILSHGSVLSAGAKFSDTSPTQRGKFVRNRLLCQEVPPPPPNVNADLPPEGGTTGCKIDRYKTHASVGSCKGCHAQMDPIGFGLENYDTAGRYRATEANKPECKIDGDGELEGFGGAFNGPAGLASKLLESGVLQKCVVTQMVRFAIGRRETADDANLISDLQAKFGESRYAFDALLLDVVGASGFGFRRAEP